MAVASTLDPWREKGIPLEQHHPSPVTAGLLKTAQLPRWQESLTVRTMKAKP